jgi:hypothetical protein
MEHFRAKVFEEKEEKVKRSADPIEKRQKKKEMMADERKGIMSHTIFPSLGILDFGPPLLHTQMGFGNATMDWLVAWIDSHVQKVGADEKLASLAHLKANEDVKIKMIARNEMME